MALESPADALSRVGALEHGGGRRCNVLLASFVAFFSIGFGAWLVSAGGRYRQEYSDATQGWRVGTTRAVELTLLPDDARNLGCASNQQVTGLRCGYRANLQVDGADRADDPHVLQPYNTVHEELLLGAGLWTSPDLKGPLPRQRFTVVCDYNVTGVLKSVAIRFESRSPFTPLGRTATVGTLTNCLLPR